MRKINKIQYNLSDVIEECLSHKRDQIFIKKIQTHKATILEEYRLYVEYAEVLEFHKANECTYIGSVDKKDMVELYNCFRSTVKTYYDQIILSSAHNICPYCCQRTVSEVDHYLPKSKKISLSIAPLNLVPICSDCNKAKGELYPKNKEERFINPHFDPLVNKRWLEAEVLESKNDIPSFNFYVDDSVFSHSEQEIYRRIEYHFTKLKLNKLYISQSGSTLTSISMRLKKDWKRGGVVKVKEYLSEELESFEDDDINSWKAAMYRAMLRSDWFCNDWCGR